MASKFYETVSDKVSSIDVTAVKQSVRGSFQVATDKLSSYWQDLQVNYYYAKRYFLFLME